MKKNEKNSNDDNSRRQKILTQEEIKEMEEILEGIKEFHEKIIELEETEVDFDDERNNSFLELHKYERKIMELYHEGCAVKGIKPDAGRPYLMNKSFKITGNRSIDDAINNCINKDYLNIPYFDDILECVRRCNEERELGMSKAVVTSCAEIAYVKVIDSLQQMRQHDFYTNYAEIYEQFEDPAKSDRQLWQKLSANESIGKKKLTKIHEYFVQKQHEELVSKTIKRSRSNITRRTRQRHSKTTPAVADDAEAISESEDLFVPNSFEPEIIDLTTSDAESEEFQSGSSAPNFAVSTLIEPGTSKNVIALENVDGEAGDLETIEEIDEIQGNSVESVDTVDEYFRNQPNSTIQTDEESQDDPSNEEEKVKRRERCLLM